MLLVAAALVFALTGCAPNVVKDSSSGGGVSQEVVEEPAEPSGQKADSQPVKADESIMATMTCEELDAERLERLSVFGQFKRAVSVEVTEKDGVSWWVVAAEQDVDDRPLRLAYLTDALELSDYQDGTWIQLEGDDPWRNVDWDHDLLVRGKSALKLARRQLMGTN